MASNTPKASVMMALQSWQTARMMTISEVLETLNASERHRDSLKLSQDSAIRLQHAVDVLRDENAKQRALIDTLQTQNEWLKDRLADLQLPAKSHKNIKEWLVECGMPAAKEQSA